eukprot:m.87628 g.87628  ORF g.87628 m.87628 type:complete len:934 (+) comp8791_c2_seq1:52-2853(+)
MRVAVVGVVGVLCLLFVGLATASNATVVCELMSSQISVTFPIVHNCTAVPAGAFCVVNCDASESFYGEPIVIDCTIEGNIVPFGAVQCVERVNTIETDSLGLHLHAIHGDVFVSVGDNIEIPISKLDSTVKKINTRLNVVEEYNIDARVTTIEDADLSGEIKSLSTQVSTQQSQAVLSLSVGIDDGLDNAKMATLDLSTALEKSSTSLASAISSLATSASNGDTSLENSQAELSSQLSSTLKGVTSTILVIDDSVDDNVNAIEGNVNAIGMLQMKMDVVEGITNALNFTGHSKETPGISCSHILIEQNNNNVYGDGMYWIDPNGGSTSDSFQVYCDMENGGWTKIIPSGSVPVAHHKPTDTGDGRSWYDGNDFSYDISDSQLSALIGHSTYAKQDAEFTCEGVIIYKLDGAVYSGAAYFKGFLNKDEFWSVNGNGMAYEVPTDNCGQNDPDVTEKAVFRFETGNPEYLPIIDINVSDDGDSVENWGLKYMSVFFKYEVRDGSSAAHAGRTCSHIKKEFSSSPDGYYFIDPNRGETTDAFQVYCDMSGGGWTHIQPTRATIPKGTHSSGGDAFKWTSEIGFDLNYKISSSQLQALQAFSTRARQDLLFLCHGVIAYRYAPIYSDSNIHSNTALRFRTQINNDGYFWSSGELNPLSSSGYPNYLYTVKSDGCIVNDAAWRSTDMLFDTSNAFALPFLDMAVQDHGDAGEYWGAQFSDVQFLTAFDVPLGATRDTAPQTCRDVYYSHPSPQSGYYFIDPNGGSKDDAVLVECDMSKGGWTGIHPMKTIPHKSWWSAGDGGRWFTDMNGGFEMPYDIPDAQLKELQAISVGGYQEIAMTCRDTIVWFDVTSVYGGAAEFAGAISRTVWTKSEKPYLQPKVNIADDMCRENSAAYDGRVKIYFDTGNPSAFPIIDIKLYDHGDPGEQWGATISTCWFY